VQVCKEKTTGSIYNFLTDGYYYDVYYFGKNIDAAVGKPDFLDRYEIVEVFR